MEQHYKNQAEQFIEFMNTSKSEKLLSDCVKGITPHWRDLDYIAMAKEAGGLPDPVINVLIHYLMLTTEVFVLNDIFTKIAVEWSSKDIKTVEEAMMLAKQEKTKYEKWIEKHYKDSRLSGVCLMKIKLLNL